MQFTLEKEDQYIAFDTGINIGRHYANSIDQVLGYFTKEIINKDNFIHLNLS